MVWSSSWIQANSCTSNEKWLLLGSLVSLRLVIFTLGLGITVSILFLDFPVPLSKLLVKLPRLVQFKLLPDSFDIIFVLFKCEIIKLAQQVIFIASHLVLGEEVIDFRSALFLLVNLVLQLLNIEAFLM